VIYYKTQGNNRKKGGKGTGTRENAKINTNWQRNNDKTTESSLRRPNKEQKRSPFLPQASRGSARHKELVVLNECQGGTIGYKKGLPG